MSSKTIVTAVFMVLFLADLAYIRAQESDKAAGAGEKKETTATDVDSISSGIDSTKTKMPPEISSRVIAYYLHSTRRCVSCRKIEAYSREAIETGFAEMLKSGKLEWIVLNTDKPENKHFLDDYDLYTKSLVLSKIEDGKEMDWKNLEKVWQFLRNKDVFMKYVQAEVKSFLGQD